ncbi:MAG: YggT family protein [SAR324 cluster bacterium]|nr:YggT family protein [SAR324 cluster bacterium]
METGSLLYVLAWILRAYSYMLVVYVLLSWVMHEEHYPPIVRWLQSMVEPVLFQIRKVIPPIGGFDISAIAALLIVEIIHAEILKLVI